MDGNGKPLWRHSASARTFHFTGVRRALPWQKKCVLSNNTMESSIKGCTTGGCVRKSIKLKVMQVDLLADLPFLHLCVHQI